MPMDLEYLARKIQERRCLYTGIPKASEVQDKMLRSTLLNDVYDQAHIFRIELINTLRCNAACSHCSNHKLEEGAPTMTRGTALKVLEQCRIHQAPSITFLGGESLTDPNLYDLLTLFVEIGMGVGLTSNGLLLDRPVIKRLKEIGVAGTGSTIYDSIPENHDRIVGVKGAFEKIMQAMNICREVGLGFSMTTIYSRQAKENGAFNRLINMSRKHGFSLKFNLLMPVGGSAKESDMLSPEEIMEAKQLAFDDPRLGTHCIFNCQAERCGIGRTYLGITPSGDMMPCYFLPVALGNVNHDSFQDYLDYAQSFPIFQRDTLPKGYCLVAESKELFHQVLKPLYHNGYNLPINLRKHPEIEEQLRALDWGMTP